MRDFESVLENFTDITLKNLDKLNNLDSSHAYNKLFPIENSYFWVLSRFKDASPIYMCKSVYGFLGLSSKEIKNSQPCLYYELLHPENHCAIYSSFKHFCYKSNEDFKMCYLVKSENNKWEWFYGVSRTLSFDKSGKPMHIFTLLIKISDLLQKPKSEKTCFSNTLESNLTYREQEILFELSNGLNNQEIGQKLHISPHTVSTHRRNLMKKLGVNSSAELMRYALTQFQETNAF